MYVTMTLPCSRARPHKGSHTLVALSGMPGVPTSMIWCVVAYWRMACDARHTDAMRDAPEPRLSLARHHSLIAPQRPPVVRMKQSGWPPAALASSRS